MVVTTWGPNNAGPPGLNPATKEFSSDFNTSKTPFEI